MDPHSSSYLVAGLAVAVAVILGYWGAPLWAWSVLGFALLAAFHLLTGLMVTGLMVTALLAAYAGVTIALCIPAVRRRILTGPLLKIIKKLQIFPVISPTEREALLAGDSWIERDLFSGKPDLGRLMAEPFPTLTRAEVEFLNGPADRACASMSDWEAWQRGDLPTETWDILKREGFFGMIIDREHGGLGLSALAHSTVIQRLASRSSALAITAMVPNSLGPAKLLLHYGTPEQKEYYLPRLARGEEVPAFALTEPEAGSDAAALRAEGVVFRGDDGQLLIRLNWQKRYTTLAPAATLLGLAFRLRDPELLLHGPKSELGITCALVPTHLAGITIDRRHDPMGVPFLNAPHTGKDVVIPVDAIIGGAPYAGRGWTMVMQSLAEGRGISLPAESTGSAKFIARVASAYAAVRSQFDVPIGNFEGVAERLAKIGISVYVMDSMRTFLCGAIDNGLKPSVATAIAKVELTELGRAAVTDAMDVMGGAGLVLGPRNLIAISYIGAPIGITVEGSNILTRSLIIFGQGAIRSHPYALLEIQAAEREDVAGFDHAFLSHVRHIIRCLFRAPLLALSRGWFAESWTTRRHPLAHYRRRLSWASARFALWSELAMVSLGGDLKRREKLTGRLADALSWMCLATATLRRFEADGRPGEDLAFARGALEQCFRTIESALDGVRANLEIPGLTWFLRGPLAFFGRLSPMGAPIRDSLELEIAKRMQTPGPQRERLFSGVHLPAKSTQSGADDPFALLEEAFTRCVEARPAQAKIRHAIHRGILHKPVAFHDVAAEACAAGIITRAELLAIRGAEKLSAQVTQVDDFDLALNANHHAPAATPSRSAA